MFFIATGLGDPLGGTFILVGLEVKKKGGGTLNNTPSRLKNGKESTALWFPGGFISQIPRGQSCSLVMAICVSRYRVRIAVADMTTED